MCVHECSVTFAVHMGKHVGDECICYREFYYFVVEKFSNLDCLAGSIIDFVLSRLSVECVSFLFLGIFSILRNKCKHVHEALQGQVKNFLFLCKKGENRRKNITFSGVIMLL